MRIIHTDSYGSDYPDEKFVTELPWLNKSAMEHICAVINAELGEEASRYYKVVHNDYVLKPGFEP